MKRITFTILILIISFSAGIRAQQTITILHVNDTHSTLAPIGPRNEMLQGMQGGIARATSVIESERLTEPNLLLLHAGDISIGDLFFNYAFQVPELTWMKMMRFDAMTLGNHEFDLTPEVLLGSLQNVFPDPAEAFPILGANVDASAVIDLDAYISDYTIKTVGTVKVGIFGLITPATNLLSQPLPVLIEEDVEQIMNIAGTTSYVLRNVENCDVVLLLSHLGVEFDKAIASIVPGIDLIIGGHDHYKYEAPLPIPNPSSRTTWVTQAGSNYMYIGKMKLDIDSEGNITLADYTLIPLDENVPEEPTVKGMVDGLITEIEEFYNTAFFSEMFGYSNAFHQEEAKDLTRLGVHDTPIGNLVTDAFRSFTGTDIAIQAGGSTGLPLWKGPFNLADIFRINGYGFNEINTLGYHLVTFDIYGEALIAGLEFGLSEIEKSDEFFIQVSGLEYKYDSGKPAGERVVSVTINENLINPQKLYSVTANQLVIFLLDYLEIPYTNMEVLSVATEFEALSAYIMLQNNFLQPKEIGRIVNVGGGDLLNHININGSFNSEPGNFLPDLNLGGSVGLKVNVKEKYPDVFQQDNLQLKYSIADLTLNSTMVEYLLVDQGYITLRGKGIIKGYGNFEYLITALDGGVLPLNDKVKVSIWNKVDGTILYSNNELIPLNSGAIIIHKPFFAKEGNESVSLEGYELKQNYPNPFNPSTIIEYQIPNNELVILKVYDILGREVATIVNEEQVAGSHQIEFNAAGYSSGIYFFTLITGNVFEKRKMTLIK